MLVSKAGLEHEEALRVMIVYIAHWNYVVQIVPVIGSLSEPEKNVFDRFISNRFRRPGTYREIYDGFTRHDPSNASITAYVDAVLARRKQ